MEIGSPSSGGDQEAVGVHVQEQEEKSGKGECASARARAHVVLFFLVVGAPSPCSSSTAGPKGGTPLGSAAAAAAVRGVGCRVVGLRAWPAGATRETPFPRSMPAAASPPTLLREKGVRVIGVGPGGDTLAARGERAVGAQPTCDRKARSAFRYRRRSVPERLAARAPLAAAAAGGSLSPLS